MEVKVEFISLQQFMPWIEEKLNLRYDQSLHGLKSRFTAFYNVIYAMLQFLVRFDQICKAYIEKNSENLFVKPLIENCLNIISIIIKDYPICLDLEFCESFLESINDKLDLLKANFHPLRHLDIDNQIIFDQIIQIYQKIQDALTKLPEIIDEIQKRVVLSVPLLKKIEDSLSQFRYPVNIITEQLQDLKQNKIFKDYQQAFNEFQNHIYKESNKNIKGSQVKKMIQLIKESCLNQLQLETILDTPIKLSQLIKNKGKKLLNEDLKIEVQNRLLKIINIMVKTDFISAHLSQQSLQDLLFTIKTLEQQKNLLNELRKSPLYLSGIEEILYVNEQEFQDILQKWQQCNHNIQQLQNSSLYQQEFVNYKSSLAISFVDVRKFSDKLWEYQKQLVQYHRVCGSFNRLNAQVQSFFLSEFNMRVQLILEDVPY